MTQVPFGVGCFDVLIIMVWMLANRDQNLYIEKLMCIALWWVVMSFHIEINVQCLCLEFGYESTQVHREGFSIFSVLILNAANKKLILYDVKVVSEYVDAFPNNLW